MFRLQWSTSALVAVSYEARALGVAKKMNASEAKKICPKLIMIQVPTANKKSNMSVYKDAGQKIINILLRYTKACERKSCDEAVLDLTVASQKLLQDRGWDVIAQRAAELHTQLRCVGEDGNGNGTCRGHVANGAGNESGAAAQELWNNLEQANWSCADMLLVTGSVLVSEIRETVQQELGFSCSGGVATKRTLAKVLCDMHKPDQQTLLLSNEVEPFLGRLPLQVSHTRSHTQEIFSHTIFSLDKL